MVAASRSAAPYPPARSNRPHPTGDTMQTLDDLFRAMFPPALSGDAEGEQWPIPLLPADIFAFCASALDRASAFNHIVPVGGARRHPKRHEFIVDDRLRRVSRKIGDQWRLAPVPTGDYLPPAPGAVHYLWKRLAALRSSRLYQPSIMHIPDWWRVCLQLILIADEASRGVGFDDANPFWRFVNSMQISGESAEESRFGFGYVQLPIYSISTASPDTVCVQPKSRTSTVGCSVRSVTHHLALLPPRGNVMARWFAAPDNQDSDVDLSKLGLLLVPYPYKISDDAFEQPLNTNAGAMPGWNWFHINQSWLPQSRADRAKFIEDIQQLVENASEINPVNGVILPEYSIDMKLYIELSRALISNTDIDFLIAGTSSNTKGEKGNFVSILPFYALNEKERISESQSINDIIVSRPKHHRWKMNLAQINQYDLSQLRHNCKSQPHPDYWEHIDLHRRHLDFFPYRNASCFSTLICEDLARIDPCQEAARAIGPNLLIALLMDGPQLPQRWPGRYATGLTEDPGSSVLTFTSLGLIERQNQHLIKRRSSDRGPATPLSYAVALWKDKYNGALTLELPRGADALFLTIDLQTQSERSLDGRGGNNHQTTCHFTFASAVPVAK